MGDPSIAIQLQDRHESQAAGTHPAPCGRTCEATAFEVEIRRLKAELRDVRERLARVTTWLDSDFVGLGPDWGDGYLSARDELRAILDGEAGR